MATKHKQDIGYSEDTRLALLEQSIHHINETLMRFEKRFDQIDERFDRIDGRLDRMDGRLDRMDSRLDNLNLKIDSNFKWLLGVMMAGFSGLFGIIAHGLHWF